MKSTILLSVVAAFAGLASANLAIDVLDGATYAIDKSLTAAEGRELYSKPQNAGATKHLATPKPTSKPTLPPTTAPPMTEAPTAQTPTTATPTRRTSPCSESGPNFASFTMWGSGYAAPPGPYTYKQCCEVCWTDSNCVGFASFPWGVCELSGNIDPSNLWNIQDSTFFFKDNIKTGYFTAGARH